MLMRSSRAGLVAVLLLGFISIAISAPVPRASSLNVSSTGLFTPYTTAPQVSGIVGSPIPVIEKRDGGITSQTLVRRKSIFTKIKEGFKKLGHKIKSGFQKAGRAIKKGFQKAGSAIKKGFQKVGKGIVKAAKKVGHFIKTTGAKIAKFGLKILSTAQSIASKVVKFIPGIGSIASKALTAASAATNFVSNKIHVSLGKKLDKGMSVMDKIRNPVGGVAGKLMNVLRREEDFELLERDDAVGAEDLWLRVPDMEERESDDEDNILERGFLLEDSLLEERGAEGAEGRSLVEDEMEQRDFDNEADE